MLKRVISLIVVTAMAFSFSAFAEIKDSSGSVTVVGDTGGMIAKIEQDVDLVTVTFQLKGIVTTQGFVVCMSYDANKVLPYDKQAGSTLGSVKLSTESAVAPYIENLQSASGQALYGYKLGPYIIENSASTKYFVLGYVKETGNDIVVNEGTTLSLFKVNFKRISGTIDSNTFSFYYKTGIPSYVSKIDYLTTHVFQAGTGAHPEVFTVQAPAATPVVTSIDVAGPGSITIPTGDTPSTATYTATVKDQDGNPMAGESVTWALEAPVTGVALTSSGNTATISVDKTAVNGSSFNLVATSSTNNTVKKTVTVSLTKVAPVLTSITINGQSSIAIPAAGSTQVAYTYIALDQYGAPIVADVTWSIVESVAGVDVSAAGVVTVANTASAGTFTLKATSGTVSGTKTITLTKAAYSGELAGPTQIPIPPSWSDNSNKRSFMFVSSNLDAAGIAALTFEIWDSSGAVVSDNTIKVTKLLQKGAPVASVDVAPNATAGNYKLVAKVGSDVIATYDFAVTKPAVIDSFDVGGDNVTRDDSRSGGKAVTLVAKNSAQITVNITSQAGENTYVIVYDNYPSVKLFGPVKVVNGSFTIDTSTLTPGKHALTVLTSNHMGSNGEYTINDVRTIYVAVEPANKIPVASTRFKSATVSGGKVTLKAQGYKDGDNKNNIGTDPLDNDVEYMFSVLKADRANTKAWKIIRGYSTNNTFTWDYQNDPIFINGGGVGKWMLQVYVRNASSWEWVNSFFIITKDLN